MTSNLMFSTSKIKVIATTVFSKFKTQYLYLNVIVDLKKDL